MSAAIDVNLVHISVPGQDKVSCQVAGGDAYASGGGVIITTESPRHATCPECLSALRSSADFIRLVNIAIQNKKDSGDGIWYSRGGDANAQPESRPVFLTQAEARVIINGLEWAENEGDAHSEHGSVYDVAAKIAAAFPGIESRLVKGEA